MFLADDCERNTTALAQILGMAGYTNVIVINDGREISALQAIHRFDLIVLDMEMPHIHGLDVMLALRKTGSYPFLPVLALSGDLSTKQAAFRAGARDFVAKPYDALELRMRIRNALEVCLLCDAVARYGRIQAELALHDSLTGLPNRRFLGERLPVAIKHAKRSGLKVAVMYIDLDGFRRINDMHGHPFGDRLFKEATVRLRSVTRDVDTLARVGGDEFVLVMGNILDHEDVARAAHTILDMASRPIVLDDITVGFTASIGIAFYPDNGDDLDTLVSSADRALYTVKKSGKNRFLYAHDAETRA